MKYLLDLNQTLVDREHHEPGLLRGCRHQEVRDGGGAVPAPIRKQHLSASLQASG